jgi:maltose O-acetyltransferase
VTVGGPDCPARVPGVSEEARRILRDAINAVSGSWLLPDMTRARILRLWGMEIGDGARISSGCFFGGPDVKIGSWTYLNQGVHIDNNGRVEIGDFCTIGMNILLATSHHELGPSGRRAGPIHGRPVTIGDGCWVGGNVSIMPGVTVGPGCVIAAGSVVTADCERDCLYAGAPAQMKRRLD